MDNDNKNAKNAVLFVKVSSNEKQSITDTAEQLDVPVSQFVREAVREKVAAIRAKKAKSADPELAPAL